jgi:OOP family OmpA-OmpF porin
MADYPAVRLRIEGHTDSRGKHEENLTLSRNRASAVMQHLIAAGVAPARLRAMGFGPELPIAPNDTPEGRARNRRVDFMVDE